MNTVLLYSLPVRCGRPGQHAENRGPQAPYECSSDDPSIHRSLFRSARVRVQGAAPANGPLRAEPPEVVGPDSLTPPRIYFVPQPCPWFTLLLHIVLRYGLTVHYIRDTRGLCAAKASHENY